MRVCDAMTTQQHSAIDKLHTAMNHQGDGMQYSATLILGTGDMVGLSANSEDTLRDIVHWFVSQFGVLAGWSVQA